MVCDNRIFDGSMDTLPPAPARVMARDEDDGDDGAVSCFVCLRACVYFVLRTVPPVRISCSVTTTTAAEATADSVLFVILNSFNASAGLVPTSTS